jgi:hypothetical protein
MTEQLGHEERIVPPGNVIERPDGELAGVVDRIITFHHGKNSPRISAEEVGPSKDVLCFAAEWAEEEIYSRPDVMAEIAETNIFDDVHGEMVVAARERGKSVFFVDMCNSRTVKKFERRRKFLKTLGVAATFGVTSGVDKKVGRPLLYAALAGFVYVHAPWIMHMFFSDFKRPLHLDTFKGRAWRSTGRFEQRVHPDEHRFTIGLRNSIMAYKSRAATRIEQARQHEKGTANPGYKMLISLGQGHEAISEEFIKSDEELLASLEKQLRQLWRVDPDDRGMWESVYHLTEIWYSDGPDANAQASMLIRVPDGRSQYFHVRLHEDERLKALVKRIEESV